MAVGAGYAGVRAMCGTSGGGFALMTEAFGLAGMIEAPVVVVEVQRGGPYTGIPAKTEQADLNQVYCASQGECPRAIIAPMDVEDCFNTAVEAFNLAEKYQMPVTIISDLLLSEHPETITPGALRHDVEIDRGEFVREWNGDGEYKRYAMTGREYRRARSPARRVLFMWRPVTNTMKRVSLSATCSLRQPCAAGYMRSAKARS